MAAHDNLDKLQRYIMLFESFLDKPGEEESPFGSFLTPEDEAQVRRIATEVAVFLKETFGRKNTYAHDLLRTIGASQTPEGISHESIRTVVGILQTAAVKFRQRSARRGIKVRPASSSHASMKRAAHKTHDAKMIEVSKQDVGKIPISDLLRMLNSGQVKAVIVTICAALGGSFWLGYYYHTLLSEKSTLNMAVENAELKKQVLSVQSTVEKLSGSPRRQNALFVWEGTWQMETPMFANVRIQFTQVNDNVSGSYKYISKNAREEIEGRIEAKTSGNVLDGKWIEYHGNSKFEGFIYFIMSFDSRSFTGRYSRNWEGNQGEYVWKGIKVN